MAKIVPIDKYCGLAKNTEIFNIGKENQLDLKQFDKFFPTTENLQNHVLSLENSALDNKKISNSEGAEIACTKNRYLLVASNGIVQEFEKSHSDYIIAVLAENSQSMEREYDYKSKVFFHDLEIFLKLVRLCQKKLLRNLIQKN